MSKVRILIVEDEIIIAQEMKHHLEGQGYAVSSIACSADEAKRALEMFRLDLILIDINLKGEEDGIALAGHVNDSYQLPFIFISSLIDKETVDRATITRPAAYLVKPYNASELFIAIDMALYCYEKNQTAEFNRTENLEDQSHYLLNDHIFIKDNYRFERVNFKDILWIKAESSYVRFHTSARSFLLTTDTLKSFLLKIQVPFLQRVHRSFAVNIGKIDALEGNRLYIGSDEIPIGKNYLGIVQDQLRFL